MKVIYPYFHTDSNAVFKTTWDTNQGVGTPEIVLPLSPTGTYLFNVNWGDGTTSYISSWNDVNKKHVYSSGGTYTISITGIFYGISFRFNELHAPKLISIDNLGSGFKMGSYGHQFYKCSNLQSIPANLDVSEVTNLDHAWFECSSLTSFPSLDTSSCTNFSLTWASCSGLTSFPSISVASSTVLNYTWSNCTGLTSFPLIDTSGIETFSGTWFDCDSLIAFPAINTSSAINLINTWRVCTSLTSFPQIDTSSVLDFSGCWGNCINLTSFPSIDTSSGITFFQTWVELKGLSSFPALNVSNGVNFSGAWQSCDGLTSFPLLNLSNGENFERTWNRCRKLTSFPIVDLSSGTNFQESWRECDELTSFPLIDVSSGVNFHQSWRNCKKMTSFANLNMDNATTVNSSWINCVGLTSFPSIDFPNCIDFTSSWGGCWNLSTFPLIDVSNGVEFNNAWSNCYALGSFPLLDFSNAEQMIGTWSDNRSLTDFPVGIGLNMSKLRFANSILRYTTLSIASYSRLLEELDTVNSQTNVNFHGGNSQYNQNAVQYRNSLTSSPKNWVITDGGLYSPAPVIKSTSTGASALDYPSGIESGDVLMIIGGASAPTDSGWTTVHSAANILGAYTKTCDGTETGLTGSVLAASSSAYQVLLKNCSEDYVVANATNTPNGSNTSYPNVTLDSGREYFMARVATSIDSISSYNYSSDWDRPIFLSRITVLDKDDFYIGAGVYSDTASYTETEDEHSYGLTIAVPATRLSP